MHSRGNDPLRAADGFTTITFLPRFGSLIGARTAFRLGDAFDDVSDLLIGESTVRGPREVSLCHDPHTTTLLINDRYTPDLPLGHDSLDVSDVVISMAAARRTGHRFAHQGIGTFPLRYAAAGDIAIG
jgi:hypothetical protein